MAAPSQIALVRHGETEWSRSGRHTGRTDVPLTETGRAQARAAATLVRDLPIARVRTSPLSRARETCSLLDCGALQRAFGYRMPDWKVDVTAFVARLAEAHATA